LDQKKISWGQKITGSKVGLPLIYCGSQVSILGSGQGQTLAEEVFLSGITDSFEYPEICKFVRAVVTEFSKKVHQAEFLDVRVWLQRDDKYIVLAPCKMGRKISESLTSTY